MSCPGSVTLQVLMWRRVHGPNALLSTAQGARKERRREGTETNRECGTVGDHLDKRENVWRWGSREVRQRLSFPSYPLSFLFFKSLS